MKKKNVFFIILGVIVVVIAIVTLFIVISLKSVNNENTPIDFIVNKGDSKDTIIQNLKDANLIRNKYVTLLYIMVSGNTNIQAGSYELARDMSVVDIIKSLTNGDIKRKDKPAVRLTFKEGITLKEYLKMISDSTNLQYDEIIDKINDEAFLKGLIDDYWFLTDDILDKDIYYALEGYLFPETYEFYKETDLNTVIRKILNVTSKKLDDYKEQIEANKFLIHDIMTMASIIEKEANSYEDRVSVSQVIYTRLDKNMNLGMDVTSYYGVKKDLKEILTAADLAAKNPYNTRLNTFIGLPIGPICNPSIESIKAALNPSNTDYIYFYADKSGKVHFTNSYEEFQSFKVLYG